ncbi:MAG: hypothetical protein AAB401_17045, partial [Acidobacteriota bacterium]
GELTSPMSLSISYKLTGSGWAECALEIDEQGIVTTASYLSHALERLLESVVELLRGQPEATASFDEEPGEYRWRFKRIDEQTISIRILWFNKLWGREPDEKGKLVFEATCRLRTFAGAVLSASQQLFAEHGIEGYKEKWVEHDFPLKLQDELKRLLAEGRQAKKE